MSATKKWASSGYVTKVTPSQRGLWVVIGTIGGDSFRVAKADVYFGASAGHGTWPNVYAVGGAEVHHEQVLGEYKTRAEAEERAAELMDSPLRRN